MRTDGEELPLGDVLEFMRAVWALDNGLQSASKRMERSLGVTGPQRLVLRVLGLRPALSAGELALVLHVHPSTLSGVLRRLEERGFIARRTDKEDRRRVQLRLTRKGQKLNAVRAGTVEAAVRRALAHVTPRQLEGARAVLSALAAELHPPAPAKRAQRTTTRS